jgi:hypothetical protein
MNIERIINIFEEFHRKNSGSGSNSEEVKRLVEKYQSIPLTLAIGDENMRRVCEVLTLADYFTISSCEGHGRVFPNIEFMIFSRGHFDHLSRILDQESGEKNFRWSLFDSGLAPADAPFSINHIIPSMEPIKPNPGKPEDYQKMIDDLDIIGISVLRYFSSRDIELVSYSGKKRTLKIKNPPNSI